ncbi:MAG: hypothetical protein QXW00_01085 [Candidatus Woesearchaeota archaeon]
MTAKIPQQGAAILFLIVISAVIISGCEKQNAESDILSIANEQNVGKEVAVRGIVYSVQKFNNQSAYILEDEKQNRIIVVSSRNIKQGMSIIVKGTLYKSETTGFYIKE